MRARGDSQSKINTRLEMDQTLFGCMTDLCDITITNLALVETVGAACAYIDYCERLETERSENDE